MTANAKQQQLEALRKAEEKLFSLDDATATRLAVMYDAARRELLNTLMDWYQKMGSPNTPDELRIVAGQVARIKEIERVIAKLGTDIAAYLKDQLPEAQTIGLENAEREIELMSKVLHTSVKREALFAGIDAQLAPMVEAVIGQIPGMVQPLAGQITFELQYSLTQGDSFDQIVQRLLAADLGPQGASFFRRGALSMELFSRRAVIDSNNASRQLVYERASERIGKIQKQAVAAIDDRTTDCCLRVHGQITDLDEPYKLTGTPRFADAMMFPAFHWRCRTSSVAYHPAFDVAAEGTAASTTAMKQSARKQLNKNEADASGG